MSRQNKNARNLAKARDISKLHANGEKGPKSTTPLHSKRWGYRTNPEMMKRIAEAAKAVNQAQKTSGKKILETAGGASK